MLKLWRRASNYVRHDLREIVAPSSLPDPPGLPDDPPPRTWAESWAVRPLLPCACIRSITGFSSARNTACVASSERDSPKWDPLALL